MPLGKGARYRYKTYPSGKRVRLAFDRSGRVIETRAAPKAKLTKTRKRLQRRQRKIGIRGKMSLRRR